MRDTIKAGLCVQSPSAHIVVRTSLKELHNFPGSGNPLALRDYMATYLSEPNAPSSLSSAKNLLTLYSRGICSDISMSI